MSNRIPPMLLSLLLALGLLAYVLSRVDDVTRAQTGGFDRTQYANDNPVGDLEGAQLPETGEAAIMIELKDDPTARVFAQVMGNQTQRNADPQRQAQASAAARAQLARIQPAQQRVLAHLRALGQSARVLYSVQTAYNGIAARIDASNLPQLKAHPDVKAVHALPTHYIDNSTSVPFINAVNAWNATSGNAGDGIRIGVIDTGVDYTHANFGGPGTVAAYTGNNRAIIEPGTFPTAKVVGGKDFVGDAYTGANTPVPDDDPLDCNGHGSHVAGTAAGLGVNGNGTTYLGPYDGTTPFSSFTIGPGVAPKAQLYALKVFGCSGGTNVTTQAIAGPSIQMVTATRQITSTLLTCRSVPTLAPPTTPVQRQAAMLCWPALSSSRQRAMEATHTTSPAVRQRQFALSAWLTLWIAASSQQS